LESAAKLGSLRSSSESSLRQRWMTFSRLAPTDKGGMARPPALIF
jgi:hypothetical protein